MQDQPGTLAQVLGYGGEGEFVFCSVRASETQAIQLQDALEVRKQHLDLLPLAPRREIGIRHRQVASEIAGTFMD
jgi:hypothetical protein